MLILSSSLILLALAHMGSSRSVREEEPQKITLLAANSQQSSTLRDYVAANAVDGNNSTYSHTVGGDTTEPWWQIDMGRNVNLHYVEVLNRPGYEWQFGNVVVTVDGTACPKVTAGSSQLVVQIHCPDRPIGRVMRIKLEPAPYNGNLAMVNVDVYGIPEVAPQQIPLLPANARQSSTWSNHVAANAVDQNYDTYTYTEEYNTTDPWWEIDMDEEITVHYVQINNRHGYYYMLGNIVITVDGHSCGPKVVNAEQALVQIDCPLRPKGQVLRIQLEPAPTWGVLAMVEVRVWGELPPPPHKLDLLGANAQQSSNLAPDYVAANAVDGNNATFIQTQDYYTPQPWWKVDMGSSVTVRYIQ
eukprot:Ihof_evm1s824 gene=Ihof_evmTU1s824